MQSVGYLTSKSQVPGSIPGRPHTSVSPSADSRGALVSYWRKCVHEVLVNRFGGLSLPRKSVVRLSDRSDMTLDVYRGRKTTTQQQLKHLLLEFFLFSHINKNILLHLPFGNATPVMNKCLLYALYCILF